MSTKPEPNPYHVLRMRQSSVIRMLTELEHLILMTPSGDMRNQLCDMNITLMQHREELNEARAASPDPLAT